MPDSDRPTPTEERRATILALFQAAGSRYVSVLFRKKDGSMRALRFNPRDWRKQAGEAASAGAKRGLEARKALYPNYVRVRCVLVDDWRTVNLDTVRRVRADGTTTRFRALPKEGVA